MDPQRRPWTDEQIVNCLEKHLPVFLEWAFHFPEGSADNDDLAQAVIAAVLLMNRNGTFEASDDNTPLTLGRTIAHNMMVSDWRHGDVVERNSPGVAAREEKRDEREHDHGTGSALEAKDYFERIKPGIEAAMPKDPIDAAIVREYINRIMRSGDDVLSLSALTKEICPGRHRTKGCRVWAQFIARLLKWIDDQGITGC
jgi:hypothetical protein